MTTCVRCHWQPDPAVEQPARDQLAEHADQAGHPLCLVCRRSLQPHQPQTCETCLAEARSLLSGVVTMWTELPNHLGRLRGQSAQPKVSGTGEPPLPGGVILALLAPGGSGTTARQLTPLDQTRGLDGREHGPDNRSDDTPSVAGVLTEIEDDWRHTRGESAAPIARSTSAAVRAASRYLEVNARWAANQHPAFDDCVEQLRGLHLRLEQATGRRRVPVKAGADCFDCGGTLERPLHEVSAEAVVPWWISGAIGPRRAEDMPNSQRVGLVEDEKVVTCRRCGAHYDGARYLLALAARRQSALDGWVGLSAAALASRRSVKTLRAWLGEHVPWALRIEPRQPTPENPSPWRAVEHLAWYPSLQERADRAQRRRRMSA